MAKDESTQTCADLLGRTHNSLSRQETRRSHHARLMTGRTAAARGALLEQHPQSSMLRPARGLEGTRRDRPQYSAAVTVMSVLEPARAQFEQHEVRLSPLWALGNTFEMQIPGLHPRANRGSGGAQQSAPEILMLSQVGPTPLKGLLEGLFAALLPASVCVRQLINECIFIRGCSSAPSRHRAGARSHP